MTSAPVTSTEELLAVLPYHMGYHLHDSLVLVLISGGALGPIARIDLPPTAHAQRVCTALVDRMLRCEPDVVVIIGYESIEGAAGPSRLHAGQALQAAGVAIHDNITVRGDRWWGRCCESDASLGHHGHRGGHTVADAAAVPAVTDLICSGSAPVASRRELTGLVETSPPQSRGVDRHLHRLWDEFHGAVDPEGVWDGSDNASPTTGALKDVRAREEAWIVDLDRATDQWARIITSTERGGRARLSDADVALLVQSLRHKGWRDDLIAWISPVLYPLSGMAGTHAALLFDRVSATPVMNASWSAAVLHRLMEVAQRVPDSWPRDAAAICTLVAAVAWGVGDGAIALDALDRARRLDPCYTLADALRAVVENQIRPQRRWHELAA